MRGLAQNGLAAGTKYRDEKPMRTCCMVERPQKITLGKMRASRVHGLLIYVPVSFRILICFIGLIGWEQAPAALARPVLIIPAVKFEKSFPAKRIFVIRSAPSPR